MAQKKVIATFGEILVEVMATKTAQSFLRAGLFSGPYPSGAPAIFINQAGLLGEQARIYGAVGADDFGTLNIDHLRKSGVQTQFIARVPERTTGVAFVRYNADGSRNFIYHIPEAACGMLSLRSMNKKFLEGVGILHIMGSSIYNEELIRIAEASAREVKKHGGLISFDPNIRPEILRGNARLLQCLRGFAKKCDIFFAGENEYSLLLNAGTDARKSMSEEVAVRTLTAFGAKYIIIKRAEQGATLYHGGAVYRQKALRVLCVDPTGAGDSFAGAFVACVNKGLDPRLCLAYAAVAGACTVSRQGPMTGAPSLAQIRRHVASMRIESEKAVTKSSEKSPKKSSVKPKAKSAPKKTSAAKTPAKSRAKAQTKTRAKTKTQARTTRAAK